MLVIYKYIYFLSYLEDICEAGPSVHKAWRRIKIIFPDKV